MKTPDQAAFKAILILVVLFARVMPPLVARSESQPPAGPPTFDMFDKDGDGCVSEDEFLSLRAERQAARAAEGRQMLGAACAPAFSEIDSNGDGRLDEAEFTAGRDAHMNMMREMHQGHGGGMDHRKGMKMPTFEDLDLDGNGCIDADEFAKHQAERHGHMHRGQEQPAGEAQSDEAN